MDSRNVRPSTYVEADDPRDPRVEKFVRLIYSRKVWTLLIGMAVAMGIVEISDVQQTELVNAVITLVGFAFMALGIAVEDGLHAIASSQKE